MADNDDEAKGKPGHTIGQFSAELDSTQGGTKEAIMFVRKGVHVQDDSELEVEVVEVNQATFDEIVSMRT